MGVGRFLSFINWNYASSLDLTGTNLINILFPNSAHHVLSVAHVCEQLGTDEKVYKLSLIVVTGMSLC